MLFTRKLTKWIPIIIYDFSGNKFLLLGRRNLKTGMLDFTSKRLHTRMTLNHNIPTNIFDAKTQFAELLNA